MKKLLLVMLFISTFTHAQLKDFAIVNDSKGEIQVRTTHSTSWQPLTAGTTFTSNTFIRLNSADSIATIQYPDGGILKLLGIGSFFFEEISKPRNNIYHSKILVFSGRWFYEDQKDFLSRFIVNSDVTTSVVEQGSGGGYFHQGTNEFFLHKGRGLISYRQENINAIVLDEKQYVNFNILDGFFKPKLATDDILRQYMIFQTNTVQDIQSFERDSYNHNFSYYDKSKKRSFKDVPIEQFEELSSDMKYNIVYHQQESPSKKKIGTNEIQINQLDPLRNFDYKQKEIGSISAIAPQELIEIDIPIVTKIAVSLYKAPVIEVAKPVEPPVIVERPKPVPVIIIPEPIVLEVPEEIIEEEEEEEEEYYYYYYEEEIDYNPFINPDFDLEFIENKHKEPNYLDFSLRF